MLEKWEKEITLEMCRYDIVARVVSSILQYKVIALIGSSSKSKTIFMFCFIPLSFPSEAQPYEPSEYNICSVIMKKSLDFRHT
jgi:hypothetical protein